MVDDVETPALQLEILNGTNGDSPHARNRRCIGLKPNGERCSFKRKHEDGFCNIHSRLARGLPGFEKTWSREKTRMVPAAPTEKKTGDLQKLFAQSVKWLVTEASAAELEQVVDLAFALRDVK